jgi:acetyltransferase-like isoleucine patch superfamily enzyme
MTSARDTIDSSSGVSDILGFVASRPRPNALLSLIAWLLPPSWTFKNWLLRKLGNHIGDNVIVGPTLVLGCGPFWLGDNSYLGLGNTFKQLRHVRFAHDVQIANFNFISAQAEYQKFSDCVGFLIIEPMAGMTNRHYLDCSGQIILRRNSGIGGLRSIFQSHEIDVQTNETYAGKIVFEENAMSGTGVLVLKGARLPEKSVLAAGSVLTKQRDDAMKPNGLYAGAPARFVRELADFAWWDRKEFITWPGQFDDSDLRAELTNPDLS